MFSHSYILSSTILRVCLQTPGGSPWPFQGSVKSVTETLLAFPPVDMCPDDAGVAGEAAVWVWLRQPPHPGLDIVFFLVSHSLAVKNNATFN